MYNGSCHCGKCRYEISGEPIRFAFCHCHDCRKFHGTAFNSAILVNTSDFKLTQGQDQIGTYESSPGSFRHFCRNCGCHLFKTMTARPAVTIVSVGRLDGDHGLKPQMHIWVSAKAPWYEIRDDLPQFQEGYKA